MNREIKFRAWDSISENLWGWDIVSKNPIPDFDLEHYTLMQYTGLKDKNGKEIYEGDIIEFIFWTYHEHEVETHYIGEIQIDEKLQSTTFVFTDSGKRRYYALYELTFDSESDIEVIGNIYENPELLK